MTGVGLLCYEVRWVATAYGSVVTQAVSFKGAGFLKRSGSRFVAFLFSIGRSHNLIKESYVIFVDESGNVVATYSKG